MIYSRQQSKSAKSQVGLAFPTTSFNPLLSGAGVTNYILSISVSWEREGFKDLSWVAGLGRSFFAREMRGACGKSCFAGVVFGKEGRSKRVGVLEEVIDSTYDGVREDPMSFVDWEVKWEMLFHDPFHEFFMCVLLLAIVSKAQNSPFSTKCPNSPG